MYVVMSGAGEVGYHVARALRLEGHDVAVIERSKSVLEKVTDLDAMLIHGNGASLDSLEQANIRKADVFIGASGSDEANMIGCGLAKSFGVKTVARITDETYLDEVVSYKYKSIGIDVAVCPELVAATKVANLLRAPALASADIFAQGQIAMVESKVLASSPIAGKTLSEIKPPPGINIVAIFHGEEIVIPRGHDVLVGGDRILMAVLSPEAMKEAEEALGLRPGNRTGRMRRLVIAGGTRIGIRLARLLEKHMEVVIIEKDKERAQEAFEKVKDTLVINGDATDLAVLRGESVETADAFVGADRVEEYNILAALVAKKLGVRNTVAFINQPQLKSLVEDTGIDLALTVRQATVSSILQWTLRMDALDLALLGGGAVQVLEVRVNEASKLAGKPLKKLDFPHSSIIGAIVRGDDVLIPRGSDEIRAGDRLIVVALTEAVPRIERLLRGGRAE
ncbi:MAG: Trk system potassium transporter TrkA [Euryarchaeota archaeon]|nr:Trk system potassium transporter TrkA [Euryarchaeota archaeon]